MTGVDEFRDAIRAAGLTPPEVIEPGQMHRFPGSGKRNGNAAGWCKLFSDGMGGVFGDWSTGQCEQWHARHDRQFTFVEQEGFRNHVERAKVEAAARREHEQADAAKRAADLWKRATLASTHPYLERKAVPSYGLRVKGDSLLVPMRDSAGTLCNVQRIKSDGSKRFLSQARVTACHHAIGEPDRVVCIAEGYATGATVHEATGFAVAIAFNAGNLLPVARLLRAKLSHVRIVICADDDHRVDGNPGISAAMNAADAVDGVVAVPEFGDQRPEDATDFNDLARYCGREAVERGVANALANGEGDSARGERGNGHDAGDQRPAGDTRDPCARPSDVDSGWPRAMDANAFYGIAGDFVRMVEPNTESDPVAILVQFLVAFGALVGRGPHYLVEGAQHHANLFTLLVGATAKGRKGTSWARVREPFERIDVWKHHVSGLSSGEGLKYNVRDAREETKANKRGELITQIVDVGVDDKRLLVIEPEFASALRAAQRQGSTLSATIRESWDSGNLRTLTKHDPIVATNAHISIIGHVTADELRTELTATDSANGFANRFLFVAVRRSKSLPFGGDAAEEDELRAFADRLHELARVAWTRQRIAMTDAARGIWESVYARLSADADGLHGAVTARAEAQVVRLALVYTLLDGADQIDSPHLDAALALWNYCDATAKHVFGASLGDRTADEIMRRLRLAGTDGLTRTEISAAFKRNLSADRIGSALDLLKRKGLATVEMVKNVESLGRPSELWRAVK